MNFIGPIFKFLAEFMGFASKRTDLKNAPDVKAAAKANQENANVDRETKAVSTENTPDIQKNLSE